MGKMFVTLGVPADVWKIYEDGPSSASVAPIRDVPLTWQDASTQTISACTPCQTPASATVVDLRTSDYFVCVKQGSGTPLLVPLGSFSNLDSAVGGTYQVVRVVGKGGSRDWEQTA